MDETYDINAAFNNVSRLFYKSNDIKSGITYNQLYTAITLELNNRGIYPNIVSKLIEKDIQSKRLIKNELGRYFKNPDYKIENVCKNNSIKSSDDDLEEKGDDKACDKKVKRAIKKPKKFDYYDEEEERAPKNFDRSLLDCKDTGPGRRAVKKNTKYSDDFVLTSDSRKKRVQPSTTTHEEYKILEEVKRKRGPRKRRIGVSNAIPDKPSPVSDYSKKPCIPTKENTPAFIYEFKSPVKSKASMMKNQCYLCEEFADVRNKEIYACSLCLNVAHEDCITGNEFYKTLKRWRCNECLVSNPAVCYTCDREYKQSDGGMVVCDNCEEFFHLNCHNPPVRLPLSEPWSCYLCHHISFTDTLIGGREDLRNTVGTFAFNCDSKPSNKGTPVAISSGQDCTLFDSNMNNEADCTPPTNLDETVIKTEPLDDFEELPIKKEDIDVQPNFKFHRPNEPIPDVDDWTSKQIADYFADRFGPNVGNAFLNHEIDGKSLKLMTRDDVTDQLGLHFGIALKVLYYIKKIQLNTNALCELWT